MTGVAARKPLASGVLAAVFSIVVWGVTFVNTKALLVQFSALEIQMLRFFIAYLALLVIHPRFDRVRRGDEKMFVFLGMTGVAVYQLLENCAIHYTNASNVSILVSLCPILTALLVWLFGHGKRITPLFLFGCLIAMIGVAMVSLTGIRVFRFRPFGDALAVCAMFSWAFYSLLVGKMSGRGYSQLFTVRRAFFWALVLTLPLVLMGMTDHGKAIMNGSFAIDLSASANAVRFSRVLNYVNLGFLGLFASAGCFVLWNVACNRLGVVRCTVGIYLIPAITVAFAYCCLGERLTVVSFLGALLIVFGVALSSWRP